MINEDVAKMANPWTPRIKKKLGNSAHIESTMSSTAKIEEKSENLLISYSFLKHNSKKISEKRMFVVINVSDLISWE